ncbi:hypothetical protein [Microbacterium terricola]|uniref:DUF5671 domain-containing protein n=1 Tax=Microbacterium terricola TaxID=344163 RepID=A0ABM8DVU4_9MICO|nr:hypothetical protein [Microbacterium terricola]UYK39556.1 hypothetical protein OAU46_12740 [Microbacterium terricola]BDV29709.1 hypothetical protein Microterr_03690 [Microbacterium terricola]
MTVDDTAARIESRLPAGGYADARTAVRAAARATLLAVVPDAERAHAIAQRQAVGELHRDRAHTAAGPAPIATGVHRAAMVVALVLAFIAPALVLELPGIRGAAFDVQDGALLSGLTAAVSLGILWYLSRFHRPTEPASIVNVTSRLYAFIGIVWLVVLASILIFRLDEINADEPAAPVIGLVLLAASGIGALVLWLRLRRSERAATGAGSLAPDDQRAVDVALEDWWSTAERGLSADERTRLSSAFPLALRALVARGAITEEQAASAAGSAPWTLWAR